MKTNGLQFLVLIALVAGLALLFWWNRKLRAEVLIREQNMAALQDSTRLVRNKAGDLEAARLVWVGTEKDLRELNAELADELEKEKGKVKTIQKITTVVRHDTVQVPTTVILLPDSAFALGWQHSEEHEGGARRLAGNSTFRFRRGQVEDPVTTITEDMLSLVIVTGLREREGDEKLEIFARTDYPGVSFDLQGAVVDPSMFYNVGRRASRFSIGPVVSVGLNQDLKPGLHVGLGVQYNLIRF